ncbi:MAG TPA: hypothetical protein VIX80_04365 [Candidatus Kapabacteria bacterium]
MKWLVTALIVLSLATRVSAQDELPTTKPIADRLESAKVPTESKETAKPDSAEFAQQMSPFSVSLVIKPALSILSIDVLPNKGASAEVYLINSAGEKIRSYLKGTLKTGKTDFSIETRSLPPGLYYIVSVIEGRQYAEKITVSK